jgi:D-2-hydroxyacid dehydrogenase (NADP+)
VNIMIPDMNEEKLNRLTTDFPDVDFLHPLDNDEVIAMAPRIEATYGFCTPELINAATDLRWIQVGSAGVERYPFDLIREKGITFTNAKEIYGPQLADHNMALILAFSRQLPFLFKAQQNNVWESRKNFPPGELAGETMLVVGLGGTGLETARRAKGFGMHVLATRRNMTIPCPDFVDALHPPDALHDLLPEADWVAVCLPLTKHTRDAFGDEEFALMKSSAYIVCVTRGGIINTEAVTRAIEEKEIAGAGLDVTDPEPLPEDHALWAYDNVIITPHASGHSPKAGPRMFELFCENVRRFVGGRDLLNVVDLEMQY